MGIALAYIQGYAVYFRFHGGVLRNRSRVGLLGRFWYSRRQGFQAFHRFRSLREANMFRFFLITHYKPPLPGSPSTFLSGTEFVSLHDKTAGRFMAFVQLASIKIWLRFVTRT